MPEYKKTQQKSEPSPLSEYNEYNFCIQNRIPHIPFSHSYQLHQQIINILDIIAHKRKITKTHESS